MRGDGYRLPMGKRLLVYDGTAKAGEKLLRSAWSTGAKLYRGMRRVDATHGAASWEGALAWLASQGEHEGIDEVQFWGHGKWGKVYIAGDVLERAQLRPDHPQHDLVKALRTRLSPGALVWFRTCETFGAAPGQAFAQHLSDFLGARVAGHTFVIGALQSGLHGLLPGARPHWPLTEGLREGTAEDPRDAHDSAPGAPNTLHFMNGRIPDAWFRASS